MTRVISFLKAVLTAEPALIGGLLTLAATYLAKFGFHVTSDQLLAWATVAVTVVSLWIRGQVTPMGKNKK